MLLKDLTKVWVSEYETVNNFGEKSKKWKYKGITNRRSRLQYNQCKNRQRV